MNPCINSNDKKKKVKLFTVIRIGFNGSFEIMVIL